MAAEYWNFALQRTFANVEKVQKNRTSGGFFAKVGLARRIKVCQSKMVPIDVRDMAVAIEISAFRKVLRDRGLCRFVGLCRAYAVL